MKPDDNDSSEAANLQRVKEFVSRDLNVPDPKKPCVPVPVLVVIGCPECVSRNLRCAACGSMRSVLSDVSLLKVWKP